MQLRELDRRAIDELGIPGAVLMENAGRGAAEQLLSFVRECRSIAAPRTLIVCGGGNNGGDGYVVARHLHAAGVRVELASSVVGTALRGDARIMRLVVERMRLPLRDLASASELGDLERFDVVVDALLGTGFEGELAGPLLEWVRAINAATKPIVVALDLPSGLDCDRGIASPEAVRAHLTTTFAAPKTGFANASARAHLGRVVLCSIGVPPELVADVAR